MENNILLDIRNITKKYSAIERKFFKCTKFIYALNEINFKLQKNKILGIVGESGSGKTTLARIILKIISPDSGDILFKNKNILNFNGDELKKYRKSVQIIFQDPYSSLNPRHRVYTILSEGIKIHKLYNDKKEIMEKVIKLMNEVGLSEEQINNYPHQFSGGQRQRISIARALSIEPELIIADEPVSSLDVSIQSQIINLLLNLKKEHNLTYIFISHDIGLIKYIADEVLVLYGGEIMEYGDAEKIILSPSHPYTKMLISSVPELGERKITTQKNADDSELKIIDNTLCPFLNRCTEKKEICLHQKPELISINKNTKVKCWLMK